MFWLLRKLLFIRLTVMRDEAARLARESCEFMTNSRMRGGNIFGSVDAITGEVRAGPPVRR